jgi:hypothetical protein
MAGNMFGRLFGKPKEEVSPLTTLEKLNEVRLCLAVLVPSIEMYSEPSAVFCCRAGRNQSGSVNRLSSRKSCQSCDSLRGIACGSTDLDGWFFWTCAALVDCLPALVSRLRILASLWSCCSFSKSIYPATGMLPGKELCLPLIKYFWFLIFCFNSCMVASLKLSFEWAISSSRQKPLSCILKTCSSTKVVVFLGKLVYYSRRMKSVPMSCSFHF